MKRVQISESKKWFDMDSCRHKIDEGTYHDGQNRISLATGGQWEHERLFQTLKGEWILERYSQWQGSGPTTYSIIAARRAMAWLLRNEYEPTSYGFIESELGEEEV